MWIEWLFNYIKIIFWIIFPDYISIKAQMNSGFWYSNIRLECNRILE